MQVSSESSFSKRRKKTELKVKEEERTRYPIFKFLDHKRSDMEGFFGEYGDGHLIRYIYGGEDGFGFWAGYVGYMYSPFFLLETPKE